MQFSIEIITDITYRILEKYSIQKYESITALSQEIEEKQLGYTRPLFENFLCIKRDSFYFYSQNTISNICDYFNFFPKYISIYRRRQVFH
jgi:hypothetical protein